MFPLDPGADATLGGMASTRASGTTAVRYGTMREAVLGLTVVIADGRAVRTGSRARKSSRATTSRACSSAPKGTLGIITEVTLRLHGRPEAVAAATCWFDSIDAAVNVRHHDRPARHPRRARRAARRGADGGRATATRGSSYPAAPMLFFEFHGLSAANVAEHAARSPRSSASTTATTSRVPTLPRRARRCGRRATTRITPRWRCDPGRAAGRRTSACRSRGWPTASARRKPIWPRHTWSAPLVGHVGDGNFHLVMPVIPIREGSGGSGAHHGSAGGACAGDGRHLLGRARRRPRQDALPRSRSTAPRRSTSCARSSTPSIRST